jgi:prevent-host-death family protein
VGAEESTVASISAFDAKTRFGALLKRVARGEEVVITRHDKPVARIVPEGMAGGAEGRRAVAALLDLQKVIGRRSKGAMLSDADVRSAIEDGRR